VCLLTQLFAPVDYIVHVGHLQRLKFVRSQTPFVLDIEWQDILGNEIEGWDFPPPGWQRLTDYEGLVAVLDEREFVGAIVNVVTIGRGRCPQGAIVHKDIGTRRIGKHHELAFHAAGGQGRQKSHGPQNESCQ
jgi:hypothetical protein